VTDPIFPRLPAATPKPQLSLCRPCDDLSSFSSADRQTCHCYRLDGGNTGWAALYFNRTEARCLNVTWDMVSGLSLIEGLGLSRSLKCHRRRTWSRTTAALYRLQRETAQVLQYGHPPTMPHASAVGW
jgi:hypothetical protein